TVSEFEVVVVDDGSTDGTAELLSSLQTSYQLKVVRQANRGPAAARNTGVRAASHPLILFLDDDVVPIPELIEMHVDAQLADPNVVVIGPMVAPVDWPRPAWIRWEEEILDVEYQAMLRGDYACTPRQFYTANATLSRARFLEVGGFDTTFKRAED